MYDSSTTSSPNVAGDMLITPKADIKSIVGNTPTITSETNRVEWLGVSENGVDEDVFLENIDTEILKEIAAEFQTLIEEEQQKEIEDPEFVLRGEWHKFIIESDRYRKIVNMGDDAMKPLFWIIYKSENQGLYEYTCCMALEEISGYDLSTDGIGWATSKDFLARFTKMVLSLRSNANFDR
jgi:hypothetical protein